MRKEKLLSDILMSVGVLPFLIVLVFVLFSAGFTGNDALGATFAVVISYGLAYLLALIFGLPAFFWSYGISRRTQVTSRYSSTARLAVIVVMFSPLVLLAFIFVGVLLG